MLIASKGLFAPSSTLTPISRPSQKKKNFKNLALGSAAIKSLEPLFCDNLKTASLDKEFNKDWLNPQSNVYANGPVEMLPNLYLGDEKNACNPEILSKYNIGFVFNVAREVENPLLDNSVQSWQLMSTKLGSYYLKKHQFKLASQFNYSVFSKKFFWDHNQENLSEYLDAAFKFIDFARSLKVGILIHCQCGVSRSASLMIAYIMKTLKLTFDSSYQYVKARSSVVSPNLSLISQLINLEKHLMDLGTIQVQTPSFKSAYYPPIPPTPSIHVPLSKFI